MIHALRFVAIQDTVAAASTLSNHCVASKQPVFESGELRHGRYLQPMLPHALWNMHCGTCIVEHALWNMHCGTCIVEHALWNMHCGTCIVEHALWNMHCGTCIVEHALWNMHCGTCIVEHALWNMHCGTCTPAFKIIFPRRTIN